MRQQSVLVFAAAVAVLAAATSAEYPAGMGNWMRPEIEGLVASTEYDQHHVLYGQYDDDEGKWTKLSFTKEGGDSESPRVAAAEVFQNVDAPHKWELIKVRSLDARDAYFTAGFAEAAVTHERIFDYFVNNVKPRLDNFVKDPGNVDFYKKQLKNMREHDSNTAIGRQVNNLVRQLDGLWAGWEFAYKAAGSPAEMADFNQHSIVYQSYIEDADMLAEETQYIPDSAFRRVKTQNRIRPLHCTVIQRLIDGELHVGHASLTNYVSMIRQLKTYEFPEGRNVTMSGYPGVITSIDDFVITGHDLHVATTALLNYNDTNEGSVNPEKLPGFMAMMVAAYQGTSAAKYAQILSELIPGSYPAMVMITDTKKAYDAYKQNTTLPAGTFYVLEMVPNFAIYRDMTAQLVADGHFLSFDVAFFPETRARTHSGYPSTLASEYYTTMYNSSAIAASPRRDLPYITNMTTMFYAMRHNNYPHDPMLANPRCIGVTPAGTLACENITLVGPNANNTNPGLGAAPRYDLAFNRYNMVPAEAMGAVDAKLTSMSLIHEHKRAIIAQVGPTFVQHKPFSFSEYNKAMAPPKGSPVPTPRGMPDTFNFPPGVLRGHASFSPKNQTQSSSGPSGGAPAGVAIAIGVVAVAAVVGAFVVVRQRRESRRLVGAGEGTNLL